MFKNNLTYVNEALGHESFIGYILVSNNHEVIDYAVLDSDVNFADHLPLRVVVKCDVTDGDSKSQCVPKTLQLQLRWDKGDVGSFHNYTACMFTPLLARVEEFLQNVESSSDLMCTDVSSFIDHIYVEIAQILLNGANMFLLIVKTFLSFGGMGNYNY